MIVPFKPHRVLQHPQTQLHYLLLHAGFFFPTRRLKPPRSGSGKPVRFDRKSEKTIQIQSRHAANMADLVL